MEELMNLKSILYCSICDYQLHKALNIEKKEIYVQSGFCGMLAEKTVEYSF